MKKFFGVICVLVVFSTICWAQTGSIPTLPTALQSEALIIRQDETGRWMVQTNSVDDGTSILVQYTMPNGSVWTSAYGLSGTWQMGIGQMYTIIIPAVTETAPYTVEVFKFTRGGSFTYASTRVDAYNAPTILTAAYEQISTSAATPFNGPTDRTFLKIVGDYDPHITGTIVVGTVHIASPEIVSSIVPSPGSPRETVIALDSQTEQLLYNTYPVTVCQKGRCDTIQKIRHIKGGGRG